MTKAKIPETLDEALTEIASLRQQLAKKDEEITQLKGEVSSEQWEVDRERSRRRRAENDSLF